jgi:hypothetical protein
LVKEDVFVACIVGDAWKRAEEIKKEKQKRASLY